MKKYLTLAMTVLGLYSCSQDELDNKPNDKNEVSRIILTADNFKLDNASRTTLSPTESGMAFAWSNTDTIGIYPESGDQVCFPIAVGTENNYAWFDGGGWALKPSSKYAAYYPFNKANYFRTSNSVLLVYDGQKQIGNATTSHLGAYDFMAADASIPEEEEEVTLAFKHINSVLRFNIKMPQAAKLTSMALVAEENVLPSKCTLNLLTTPATLTPIKSENTIFLDLAEIEVTQTGEQITLYMMIPPCNLTDKSLNAHLIDDKGNSYSVALTGKNFEAGMAYSFDVEATVSEATTDVTLSSAGTLLDAIGGYDNLLNIKKLKITGEMNGDDVYEIRRMTNLEYLNLKDAKIVEGGKLYYDYNSITKEGEIGDHMFYKMENLKKVIIPLNTKVIANQAFWGCKNLHTIILNEGLETIGYDTFCLTYSLTQILLPESLIEIGSRAFRFSGLTSISIPENVTTIGQLAFDQSSNNSTLKEIHIKGKPEILSTIGTDAFDGVYETATLHIPKGTKEAYSKTELGRFVNIVEEPI